jgi:hypothetical protein
MKKYNLFLPLKWLGFFPLSHKNRSVGDTYLKNMTTHEKLRNGHQHHPKELSLLARSVVKHEASMRIMSNFFLIRIAGGGVQAGSTRHVGHWMAYCTCPGWLWWWRIWWNEDWQGKPKYSENTCPSTPLSTTNPTWPDPGASPGHRLAHR